MPTLEWIGKSKVINHHQDVPFRVLERKYSFDENGQHSEDNGSENMIIRGDNLEALKALLPRYEGRVKCIYIDPPYNTGNEGWVYNDNVNDPKIKKWLGEVVGKEGEDLTRHDKWLCMMYPRLKLLQKLLADDGCLIISISYHELHNLVNLLREIFGTKQVVTVTVQTSGGKPSGGFNYVQEYLVFVVPADFHANALDFCGGNNRTPFEGLTLSTFDKTQRPNQTYPIFIDENGVFAGVGKSLQEQIDDGSYTGEKADFPYDYSIAPQGKVAVWPVTAKGKQCVWRQISGRLQVDWEKGYIKISKNKSGSNQNQYSVQYLPSGVIKKIKDGELEVLGHEDGVPTLLFGENQTVGGQVPTIWAEKAFFTVNGTQTLKNIFPESPKTFDYPKSVALIESVVQAITKDADIILDSFAGSGTTAHAVLNMNKADGGHRKFIMVQLPEKTDEKSEAYKAGYKNICEIGKERIRRAGRKIKEDAGLTAPADLDIGFRCLRLDESNMKPVYYTPDEVGQEDLFSLVDNVKPDRTPEDLLFQVMLDLGVLLSSPIEVKEIAGKRVFNVADGFLLACFDHDVTEETVKAIAQMKPYYAVFRDSSMANDSVATNFDQIFETYSPETVRKVL